MSISVADFLTRLLLENGPHGPLIAAEPPPPGPKGRWAARRERLTPGRRLLDRLWDAGYRLQLVQSDSNPTGFMIIPIGPITPNQDLLAAYQAHHDAAVMELLEACRACGIDPLRWHELVSTIVAKSGGTQA